MVKEITQVIGDGPRLSSRALIIVILLLNAGAHLVLLSSLPLTIRTLAAILIAGFVPGTLLVALLLGAGNSVRSHSERLLFGLGAGYAVWSWVLYPLSYLPGGLDRGPLLGAFDSITLLLAALLWLRQARAGPVPANRATGAGLTLSSTTSERRWLLMGVLTLLFIGGSFRFVSLGDSQFQGDEATPLVRAAAVAQGEEEALFLHRRGPVEILLPASLLALTGQLTEASGRLPFALASLLSVLTVFLLGWRLTNAPAGWIAALLLAFDGHSIGFGRVLHYESIVLLTAALGPAVMVALVGRAQNTPPPRLAGHLVLAALFAATGLAAHYDGIVMLLPLFYLLWQLRRSGVTVARLAPALAVAASVGAALLASFYLPFALHPAFLDTYTHYRDSLVSDQELFVNHLVYFAESMALYNGGLRVYLLLGLTLATGIWTLWRQRHPIYRWLAITGGGICLVLVLTARLPVIAGHDLTPWLFALLLGAILLAPDLSWKERLLWSWFALPLFLALFLTKTPGIHFYVFFIPWFLLCGMGLSRLLHGWHHPVPPPLSTRLALSLVCCLFLVNGYHARLFFLDHREFALRQIENPQPPWLWPARVYHYPHGYYGIPHDNSWKAIGVLYDQGQLRGSYHTNVDRWVTDWYTRGAEVCEEHPDNLLIERFTDQDDAQALLATIGHHYQLWGTVATGQQPRLDIYRRTGVTTTLELDAADFEARFDAELSGAPLPLTAPAIAPRLERVNYRFGEEILLTGYGLHAGHTHVGGSLWLTLQWRPLQRPAAEYTLFAQVIGPENRMIGQRDTLPSCDAGPTPGWNLDERPVGYYQIPIFAGESPGVYPLRIGLYHANTHERLPVFDEAGQFVGDAVELTQVRVDPEVGQATRQRPD